MKRILIATLFGLVAGAICATMGYFGHLFQITALTLPFVFLNRAVMAFAIGISSLKMRWAWHGILVGIAVGSIFSWWLFIIGVAGFIPLINFFANGVFGLMIEFFTTVVFKQPAATRNP